MICIQTVATLQVFTCVRMRRTQRIILLPKRQGHTSEEEEVVHAIKVLSSIFTEQVYRVLEVCMATRQICGCYIFGRKKGMKYLDRLKLGYFVRMTAWGRRSTRNRIESASDAICNNSRYIST